jgi:hypothetical protein
MIFRFYLPVLFFTFLFSCQGTGKENNGYNETSSVVATQTPEPPDTLSLGIGCYYKLDDKYSTVTDQEAIDTWWKRTLVSIEQDGMRSSLFGNNGGGPNGAEWNPSTDLYIVACLGDSLSMPSLEFEINGKPAPGIGFKISYPHSKKGTFVSFVVPLETWQKNLHRLPEERAVEICGDHYTDPTANTSFVEIMLRITTKANSTFSFIDFFHAAYGE